MVIHEFFLAFAGTAVSWAINKSAQAVFLKAEKIKYNIKHSRLAKAITAKS